MIHIPARLWWHGGGPGSRAIALGMALIALAAAGATVAYEWSDGADVHASAALAPAHPHALAAARPRALPADLPSVGHGIADATRTCLKSTTKRTPLRAAECALWDTSGPVNFVITTGGMSPEVLLRQAGWTTAQGNWLVAGGYVGVVAGCNPGWRDSTVQMELRLDRTRRRHVKLINADCPRGTVMVFGNAHTDAYDLRRCHGDHMVDADSAREALVASLRGRPGVTISYRQDRSPATTYAGGCGQPVGTDGRVAYITVNA